MGIPEGDELVAELPEVFLHGKAAFLKDTVTLLDHFIDPVPAREDHIERYPGLFGAPDEGFSEKTKTVRDAECIERPGLGEITGNSGGLDAEKIVEDFLVPAFPQHVVIVGKRIHLFKLGRHNPAGAEDNDMVLGRLQYL